jgi:hypothetical protein
MDEFHNPKDKDGVVLIAKDGKGRFYKKIRPEESFYYRLALTARRRASRARLFKYFRQERGGKYCRPFYNKS